MDAQPERALLAKALNDHGLEAILSYSASALFRLQRDSDGLQDEEAGTE
jgi:hypothetical protein